MKIELLILALLSSVLLRAAPPWADTAFPTRCEVTVSAGMTPGEATIASVKIPHAAPGGVMLTDNQGKFLPCTVKQDNAGDWYVGWKPEKLKMLEKRRFQLYFGSKTPSKPAEGFPELLPGMNVVPNGNLKKISDGIPEGWFMSSRGSGLQDKWNDTTKKQIGITKMNGANALEFKETMVIHVKLTPGRQYELSYDGWFDKGNCGVSLWFRGKTIHEYLKKELNVSNYKMQTSVPRPNEVMHVTCSSFGFMDLKTQRPPWAKNCFPTRTWDSSS